MIITQKTPGKVSAIFVCRQNQISIIWTEHSCLVSYLKYETKQLKFENFFKHGFKTAYLENEELQRW
jgi:hypothetical protein